MKIWVDADACPKPVKEILFRVADRTEILLVFVANQRMRLPDSPFIQMIQVGQGEDVADDNIVCKCEAGDLIIRGIEGAINKKRVTYDFHRLMENATKLKCSEFGNEIIANM